MRVSCVFHSFLLSMYVVSWCRNPLQPLFLQVLDGSELSLHVGSDCGEEMLVRSKGNYVLGQTLETTDAGRSYTLGYTDDSGRNFTMLTDVTPRGRWSLGTSPQRSIRRSAFWVRNCLYPTHVPASV